MIKLRPTAERSSTSMVVEPPHGLINSPNVTNATDYIRWRHMKYVIQLKIYHIDLFLSLYQTCMRSVIIV